MVEIWKDVCGYEGLYMISNLGNVLSKVNINGKQKGRIMKQSICGKGYLKVVLCKNGEHKQHMIHRLVAEAFIPNPERKETVNHIDGNKKNNSVDNLEWNTYSENLKHAYKNGLNCWNSKKGRKMKSVEQLDKDTGEVIARYQSIGDALRAMNAPPSHHSLTSCCNKRKHYKTFYGYKWRWAD